MKRRRGNEIFFVSPSASHNDALFCGSEDLIVCSTNYAKKDEIEVYYLLKLASKGEASFEQSSIGVCETKLAKTQTDIGKTQANIGETQANLGKSQTDLSKTQTDINKSQTDLSKTQIKTTLSETESQTSASERVATLKQNESVNITSREVDFSSSDTNLTHNKTSKQATCNGNETNIGENKASLGESFEKNIENENNSKEKEVTKINKTSKFKMLESFYQNKEFGKIEEFVKAFSNHTYITKDYNVRYVNFKIEIVDKGIASNYKRVLDTKDASINTLVSLDENEIYRKVYVCQNNLFIKITSKNKKCSFRFEIEEREDIKIEHNGRNEFKIFDGNVALILSLKTDGEIVINKNGFQIEGSTSSVLNLNVPCFKASQKENQEKEVKNTQVEFFLKNQDRSIEEQIFLFKQGEVPTNLIKNIFNYSCSLLKLLPFIIKATKYDYFFNENAGLKEQKANLSDKICTLSNENGDFCAGIGGLDSENGGLDEKNGGLSKENIDLCAGIGGLDGKTGGLGGGSCGFYAENGGFANERPSLNEKKANLSDKNCNLSNKNGDFCAGIGGLDGKTGGLTNENGGLSGNKESLGDENVGAHNEEKSLRKENGVFKNFSFNKVNYVDSVYSLLSLLYTKKDETGFVKEYILDIVKNTDKYKCVSKNLYDKDGVYLLKGVDDLLVLDKNGASLIVLLIYEYFKVTGDEEILGLSFDFIRGVYEFYDNFFTKSVTGTYESSFGVLGSNLCKETGNKLAHSLASDFASARVVFMIYKKCLEVLHKAHDDSLQEKLQAIPSLEVSSGGIIKEYQTNLISPKSTNCEIDFLFPFNFGVRKIDTTSDYDMVVSNSAKFVFMSAVGGFSSSEVLKIVLLLLTCGDIKSGNTIMNILLKVFLKSNLTFQNDDIFNFGLGRIGKSNENEYSFVQNYIFIRLIYNMFLSSTSNKLYINGTFLEGFSKLRLSNYSVDSALKVQEVVNVKRRVLKLELYSLKDRNLTLVLPKNMKKFKIRGEYVFDASHNSLNISLVKNKKRKLKIILSK